MIKNDIITSDVINFTIKIYLNYFFNIFKERRSKNGNS